jgi:hypothetical protein
MSQKTKISKDRKIVLSFLRLFHEYRELEELIIHKIEAEALSAATIRTDKLDIANLQKKIVSDSNLIESLNRYIATLEKKSEYQADMLKDLKRQLKERLAKKKNKPRKKS